MGLPQGRLDHWNWEVESCGAAHLCRSSGVFEETEVLRNRSCHPFKEREKKVDREDDSVADVRLRRLYLSTGDGQHFTVGEDGSVAMEVHQVLQKPVMPLLPHYDVVAVLRHIDHEMSAAVLSSDGRRGEGLHERQHRGKNTGLRSRTDMRVCNQPCSR